MIEVCAQRIVVRNQQGQVWDLPRINVDSGHSMYLDGELMGEQHPKFAEYFRHALLQLETEEGSNSRVKADRQWMISNWRWLLERNGFDPDETPKGECPVSTGGPKRSSTGSPRVPVRTQARPETPPRRMNS